MKKEKVLVLMGGSSEEREISLKSGQAVLNALRNKGYEASGLDLKCESINNILSYEPDLVFIALHGKNGEDGTVQGMLEIMGIPYTGSGVSSSAICMDKVISKRIMAFEGIPSPGFSILRKSDFENEPDLLTAQIDKLGLPLVVKPATQGSSIGTSIVKNKEMLLNAIEMAFKYDKEILLEEFIDGLELTAPVIGNEDAAILPLIEITSENEFYDYESKYTPGMCHHIIPARIDDLLREKINKITARVYNLMGCRGFARIDFMVDKDAKPYVLEVNTIPGMTEMSLVPDAARAAGISFDELVEKIVKLGLEK